MLLLCALLAAGVIDRVPELAAQTRSVPFPAAPRLDPDPQALRLAAALRAAEAAGVAADWQPLLQAALWSSGAAPVSGADGTVAYAAEAELRGLVAELLVPGFLPGDERARAEAVLTFMHARLLRSYAERQTRLDTLQRQGTYNCVSSAVLYLILGRSAGLDVRGVVTRDHAFCTVSVGGELIDVETTSPYGFDPGSKTEFHDEFGRLTGFSYVSPRKYRERTPLAPAELVSLILSNRIADADAAGRYAETVGYALDRRDLLNYQDDSASSALFGSAQKDLQDRLLNYGALLARAGRETDALHWAETAQSRFGDDPRWRDFSYSALNNRVVKLLRSGDAAAGREALERYAGLVAADRQRDLDRLLTDAELVALVQGAGDDAAADAAEAAIQAALERQATTAERAAELRVFVVLAAAERSAAVRGYAGAVTVLDRAIDRLGQRKPLLDARRVYVANRVAELHNTFARLYNEGRYAAAREAAAAALKEFPGDARLGADLDFVEKIMREKR